MRSGKNMLVLVVFMLFLTVPAQALSLNGIFSAAKSAAVTVANKVVTTVNKVVAAVKTVVQTIKTVLTTAINTVKALVEKVVSKVSAAIDWVKDTGKSLIDKVTNNDSPGNPHTYWDREWDTTTVTSTVKGGADEPVPVETGSLGTGFDPFTAVMGTAAAAPIGAAGFWFLPAAGLSAYGIYAFLTGFGKGSEKELMKTVALDGTVLTTERLSTNTGKLARFYNIPQEYAAMISRAAEEYGLNLPFLKSGLKEVLIADSKQLPDAVAKIMADHLAVILDDMTPEKYRQFYEHFKNQELVKIMGSDGKMHTMAELTGGAYQPGSKSMFLNTDHADDLATHVVPHEMGHMYRETKAISQMDEVTEEFFTDLFAKVNYPGFDAEGHIIFSDRVSDAYPGAKKIEYKEFLRFAESPNKNLIVPWYKKAFQKSINFIGEHPYGVSVGFTYAINLPFYLAGWMTEDEYWEESGEGAAAAVVATDVFLSTELVCVQATLPKTWVGHAGCIGAAFTTSLGADLAVRAALDHVLTWENQRVDLHWWNDPDYKFIGYQYGDEKGVWIYEPVQKVMFPFIESGAIFNVDEDWASFAYTQNIAV